MLLELLTQKRIREMCLFAQRLSHFFLHILSFFLGRPIYQLHKLSWHNIFGKARLNWCLLHKIVMRSAFVIKLYCEWMMSWRMVCYVIWTSLAGHLDGRTMGQIAISGRHRFVWLREAIAIEKWEIVADVIGMVGLARPPANTHFFKAIRKDDAKRAKSEPKPEKTRKKRDKLICNKISSGS